MKTLSSTDSVTLTPASPTSARQSPASPVDSADALSAAEQAVDRSLARFEDAMDQFATKVEQTSARVQSLVTHTTERVQNFVEVAQKPVEDLRRLKSRVERSATPLLEDVKANPRSWLVTVMFMSAALALATYLTRSRLLAPSTHQD